MIVVSDTSALYALGSLEKLELLRDLYGSVVMPTPVLQEWKGLAPCAEQLVESMPWIQISAPADKQAVAALQASLDEGEAEAIVLAMECDATFLLIDEQRGRNIAGRLGLQLKGTLAVLEGKAAGLLDAVLPLMDRLISEINFRISKSLYLQIAIQANEQ